MTQKKTEKKEKAESWSIRFRPDEAADIERLAFMLGVKKTQIIRMIMRMTLANFKGKKIKQVREILTAHRNYDGKPQETETF